MRYFSHPHMKRLEPHFSLNTPRHKNSYHLVPRYYFEGTFYPQIHLLRVAGALEAARPHTRAVLEADHREEVDKFASSSSTLLFWVSLTACGSNINVHT